MPMKASATLQVSHHTQDHTFTGKERVKKREDFQRLYHEGTRFHAAQYSLLAVENKVNRARIAVSVKRRIGDAVRRNYEKRLCREVFRMEKKQLEGLDVLVMVRGRSSDFKESYHTLRTLFQRCSQRIRLKP